MKPATQNGFTLLEMAIVLMIVGLLLGGILATISGQVQQQRVSETLKQLNDIQQALIGYAVNNGRFPCPGDDGPPVLDFQYAAAFGDKFQIR